MWSIIIDESMNIHMYVSDQYICINVCSSVLTLPCSANITLQRANLILLSQPSKMKQGIFGGNFFFVRTWTSSAQKSLGVLQAKKKFLSTRSLEYLGAFKMVDFHFSEHQRSVFNCRSSLYYHYTSLLTPSTCRSAGPNTFIYYVLHLCISLVNLFLNYGRTPGNGAVQIKGHLSNRQDGSNFENCDFY